MVMLSLHKSGTVTKPYVIILLCTHILITYNLDLSAKPQPGKHQKSIISIFGG